MCDYKCLSGSGLKLIAVFAMLIDHTAKGLLAGVPFFTTKIGCTSITPLWILVSIGRIAFPIFAFLIVEGYLHTHNKRKYGMNLLLFAFISEIPWNLVHKNSFFCPYQNVFFTLFLGYIGICVIDYYKNILKKQAIYLVLLFIASILCRADYGCKGFGLILLLYILREQRLYKSIIGSCFMTSTWRAGLAFIPIAMYNGERGFIQGKWMKYAFYLFYPLHLWVIYAIKLYLQSKSGIS